MLKVFLSLRPIFILVKEKGRKELLRVLKIY